MSDPLRILILEDCPADAELMERELRRGGLCFDARLVADEPQFAEALNVFRPHVVLSDYQLPQFDARGALEIVQTHDATVPLIVVTGSLTEETAAECIKAGAADYVLKERLTRLGAAVQGALEIKRAREEKLQAEEALLRSHEELEKRVLQRTAELSEANAALNLEIQERLRAEGELANVYRQVETSRDDLVRILDELEIGTAMTGPDGRIGFLSRTALRLLGLRASDAREGDWEGVLPFRPEDTARLKATQALPAAERSKILARIDRSPSSVEGWVEVDVRDDPDDPRRRIFVLHDRSEVYNLRRLLDDSVRFQGMVGKSNAMKQVFQQIRDAARVNSTVLIEGETGTGKELVARALHAVSPRAEGRFVPVNCAGLAEALVVSQLFGHRRGAFTGAIADQEGVFEAADGGTLFLDEVGDIPLSVQTSLLRVLEEREVVRLGETRARDVDVRVIAATHHSLSRLAEEGRFRQDLLYRIRVARIELPSLSERREDIPLLAETFLSRFRGERGGPVDGFAPNAVKALLSYHWPGNVRELRNAVEFALVRSRGSVLRPEDLPPEIQAVAPSVPGVRRSAASNREQVLAALKETRGHRADAARRLGISRPTLYRWLAALGIDDQRKQ